MQKKEFFVKPPVSVVEWIGEADTGCLRLLDQTRLPLETVFVDCRDIQSVFDAIRRLVVRGAPAIGVAAGYGLVVASQNIPDDGNFLAGVQKAAAYLEESRPTAVNLSWALRRVCRRVRDEKASAAEIRRLMLKEARDIHVEDEAMCLAIGHNAMELVLRCRGVHTHCNAGALATAGIGTATAGLYLAHAAGHRFTVYCDETRPLLQGSRLTAWELMQAGIDTVLITDNMAAQVMREGRVQMVITGADRIAANGDAANKIGTYGLAILARRHGIDFYIAAPASTFDLSIADGSEIPIEERASEEITEGFGRRTAPQDVRTYSPAFDVTPAELITGLITDRGIIRPVNRENVMKVIGGQDDNRDQ
jgi:methylthioribose-1-phosphate isomerase